MPDFSVCGYAAGSRPLPIAPVHATVAASPEDATARIQAAIDYVGGLNLDTNGIRGAVLLLKGVHKITASILITNSGVVLRGQGNGPDGTVLMAEGLDRRTLVRILGRNDLKRGQAWDIADDYVPVGATRLRLDPNPPSSHPTLNSQPSTLNLPTPGQQVQVIRPSTAAWIQRLGAAELGGGIGGGWKPGTRDIVWDVGISSIDGSELTLDAPLTTAIEKEMGGGQVISYEWPGRLSNTGVENLSMVSRYDESNPKDEDHAWCGVTIENAQDCWVRQVEFRHFAGSAVAVYETCRRVTVQDCIAEEPVSEIGGYRRHTFFTMGQQTLFLRCYAENGRHDFSLGHCAPGPNAFVQCEAREALADSGPIESWVSGVLYDNVVVDGNAISLGFRPGNNGGVGWSAANCVLWNCSAAVIRCWNPPGAQNWAFGSWAGFEGDGIWRGSNEFMDPDSLYAAQVQQRFGSDAAERLRLMPRPREESSNPPLDRAQELAAASHSPAPGLRDYIRNAGVRDPIDQSGSAVSPKPRPSSPHSTLNSQPSTLNFPQLAITNGWLTCNGRLLIGGTATVPWWRGTIRPAEAVSFGPAVTRFVPGRVGPGFTDDLNEVADALIRSGITALDHNYGLWYDRRRDDHERVRRMDGDVLPPFYEQPFARSGQGTAWDGLSKYDLTKYNPWYWSRLRRSAEICAEHGLVLFHQNYFQHNILEAGAHWADFPWRSANNINQTGFPEPPPYVGDKRIFQAELFYDTQHPVRRDLHRAYIRQCLSNFTNIANVIQFTSAEFTGPLHFMQFWLDTIADWQAEHSGSAVGQSGKDPNPPSMTQSTLDSQLSTLNSQKPPLIALSATKDVQDAILSDPQRSATVDLVDFRYWWRTPKGEFAPPGGKNLAPRQFERQWRGGRPGDHDLAGMAAEYRAKYPDKALICDFDTAGWAWVCAGGSMPRLPATTDPKLLEAIPKMTPLRTNADTSVPETWALCEIGRQRLVYFSATATGDLDLSDESGSFRQFIVNRETGTLTAGEILNAGATVRLPKPINKPSVVWLVKEKSS